MVSWKKKGSRIKEHEWEKHGTCTEDVLPTQLDFFSEGITLHTSMDFYNQFNSAGLTPGSSYSYSDFVNALQKQNPSITPMIMCTQFDSKTVIDTIAYCVSKQNFQIFQCNSEYLDKSKTNCPDSGIYFPTIQFES